MKKFIVSIIGIITIMLYIASPIFSIHTHAAEFTLPLVDVCEDCVSGNTYNNCYPLSNFLNIEESYVDFYAIYFYGRNSSNSETETVMIKFKTADVVFENNILSIDNAVDCALSWYDQTTNRSCFFNNATLDFNKRQFLFYDNGSNAQLMWFFENQIFNEICVVKSNIPEFLNSGGLNLEVNFTPSLVGNVDRKINGIVSEDFQIEIINHSKSVNAQCLMAICPSGQDINFYDRTDSAQDGIISGVISADSKYNYLWWSDEWNYNYTSTIQTSFAHAHHPVAEETFTTEKTLGPCPWHYVGADGTLRHSFSWSQINLEKFGTYTVYVYAVQCNDEVASRQAAFPTAPHYVDYSAIECVYSSNFTLTNGYTYDQNNTAHGNYVTKGNSSYDSQILGWSSKGTMDSNGNVDIKAKDLQNYLDTQRNKMSDYTDSYISPNWDNSPYQPHNNGSVSTSLKSHFNNFMSFINYGFGKLPNDIRSLYIYGFVAVVVLAIVFKVVK